MKTASSSRRTKMISLWVVVVVLASHLLTSHGVSAASTCENDTTWSLTTRNGSVRTCGWVSDRPEKRCNKRGDDDRWASEACVESCKSTGEGCQEEEVELGGEEVEVLTEEVSSGGCSNDSTWTLTNRKGKVQDCNWIARKPDKRCGKKGDDGRRASEACPEACGSCPPTAAPIVSETSYPSGRPSSAPSGTPSEMPSANPSETPSGDLPSSKPSKSPSESPSSSPTQPVNSDASISPSEATISSSLPSTSPSGVPSSSPSSFPSDEPSTDPSASPAPTWDYEPWRRKSFGGSPPVNAYPLGPCQGDCDTGE